ncbi:protein-L-isoaspartate(D-aspartate) O-methyltransferase [Paraburkholderia metrosideri]|jgi:protein-L-isoaspartate(D-aspartate) O-methyltransferase|uniref:Protein-L-isoaspartate O-methyltransferase n=1 Tax=Paraburkholderia metrosideri TaxID=580937 RepID=A0ABN7HDP5_9BURK|nr:protein-L-isoaspartate(D-aspartate) O-methyltransferase [Paraburkholderia metrosideri]CAD6510440.1 Protein-L-isoaspartate O-methyltransferase [Paraburkholderia metrosideri]
MTNERAKRFPLGLEDLVREPRRPEGRPGEVRAAALAASAALNARQQPARNSPPGPALKSKPQSQAQARLQTAVQARPQPKTQVAPQSIAPPRPQAAPSVKSQTKSVVHVQSVTQRAASSSPLSSQSAKPATRSSERTAAPNVALNGALALTSERVRERMVERLRANGVTDQRVLNAMAVVPRHMFVDPGLAAQAYEDAALPIGHHQTISKPSVVARMIELAAAGRALDTVLEIGTGCGYQAAVLSQVAREVYSIERIKPLSERAKTNLRPLRIPNIRLHYGDGRLGLPSTAPFDAIVIAAAGLDVPQALLEQLAIGGRLVAPVGSQDGQNQVLTLVERLGPAQWRESRLDRVFFVPLKSGVI